MLMFQKTILIRLKKSASDHAHVCMYVHDEDRILIWVLFPVIVFYFIFIQGLSLNLGFTD